MIIVVQCKQSYCTSIMEGHSEGQGHSEPPVGISRIRPLCKQLKNLRRANVLCVFYLEIPESLNVVLYNSKHYKIYYLNK